MTTKKEKIKTGKFQSHLKDTPLNEYPYTVQDMITKVEDGECDWSQWTDWIVVGQYDNGKLISVVVAKIQKVIKQ